MATPRFAWGIDVGNRALKAIKLVRDGETFRIDDFEVIEHEQILSQAGDNRESLLQSALANFAQRHPSKGGAVAIGVSGQASFARFIKLPPVDPSKISEIVKFEAVQQIPFPLDDVEWSYQLFQTPDSPEVEVGIFAMRRELVNQTIKNFTDVGLQVNVVQMNPLADYNGLYHDERIDGTTMIVDVGAENSDLIIAEGENIWMRSIPIGGNNFTEALVKSFKLKFPKAEELKRNAATSKYGRQILQAMKPVFSDLVSEIQRSIGFYSSTHRESRIAKVLALGGTFRLPGLQKYLQQNLSLDVVRIDRLNAPTPADAKFATEFNENILSSVGAYGLALQAMGQAKISSSLLPEKIRRERMWKEKTIWFAAASLLIVAGSTIPVARLYADRFAYQNQENTRAQIKAIDDKGKALDGKWKHDVENSGTDDRNQITNYLTLLNDRDHSIGIAMEIGNSIPAIDPREYQKPRNARRIVELVGYTMRYEPDLTSVLGLSEDQFNEQVDKVETPTVMPAGRVGNPGFNRLQGGRTMNPHIMGGAPPAAEAPKAGANDKTAKRGYVVTIICRTPAPDATGLIASTVAKYLRGRDQQAPDAPHEFSIERVTIPSTMRISAMYPTGTTQMKQSPLEFKAPEGNKADEKRPDFQMSNNRSSLPALRGNGGQVQPGSVASADLFPDPMRPAESTRDDSMVTILAAIVIDPPAPAKSDKKP